MYYLIRSVTKEQGKTPYHKVTNNCHDWVNGVLLGLGLKPDHVTGREVAGYGALITVGAFCLFTYLRSPKEAEQTDEGEESETLF